MSYESGKVTAAISGSVTTSVAVVPAGATLITKSATASGSATTNIHTVTAGKTFYLVACAVSGCNSGSVGTGNIWIRHAANDANVLSNIYIAGSASSRCQSVCTIAFPAFPSFAATTAIDIRSDGAQNTGTATIIGYEV